MNEPNVWMGLCESTDIRTASSCSRQIKGLHSDLLQAYSAKAAQSVSAEAAVAELDAHLSQRAQVWAARLEEQQAASVAAAERTEQLQRASLLEDARRPLLARVRALEVQLRAAQDQAAQAGVRGKGGGKMRSSMGKAMRLMNKRLKLRDIERPAASCCGAVMRTRIDYSKHC